jgi:hypothetical protein
VARLLALLGLMVALSAPATMAWAQDYPASTTVTTDPCTNGRCGTTPTIEVRGSSTLPFTGGDVALVAALGAAAAGVGVVLVLAGRRSSSAA